MDVLQDVLLDVLGSVVILAAKFALLDAKVARVAAEKAALEIVLLDVNQIAVLDVLVAAVDVLVDVALLVQAIAEEDAHLAVALDVLAVQDALDVGQDAPATVEEVALEGALVVLVSALAVLELALKDALLLVRLIVEEVAEILALKPVEILAKAVVVLVQEVAQEDAIQVALDAEIVAVEIVMDVLVAQAVLPVVKLDAIVAVADVLAVQVVQEIVQVLVEVLAKTSAEAAVKVNARVLVRMDVPWDAGQAVGAIAEEDAKTVVKVAKMLAQQVVK